MTVTNSTFSGNTEDGISAGDNLTVSGSTFSGSFVGIDAGTMVFTNSTSSGNQTGLSIGNSTFTFATIANNTVTGIIADGTTVTIGNTILSDNNGHNLEVTFINSLGHNISSDNSGASGLTKSGDLNDTNPMIGPLASNGGPTEAFTVDRQPGHRRREQHKRAGHGSARRAASDRRRRCRGFRDRGHIARLDVLGQPRARRAAHHIHRRRHAQRGNRHTHGAVTFTIDGVPQTPGNLMVVNGVAEATLMTSSLTVGEHTIGASYGGGTGFSSSPAMSLMQTIEGASRPRP